MTEKFFVRGNLALDWEHVLAIMPDCKCVVVDSYGDAYASARETVTKDLSNKVWNICFLSSDVLLGSVGEQCPDWQELIFERPQAPRLPDGFWEAVDILHGEKFEWFYINANGYSTVMMCESKPERLNDTWWQHGHGYSVLREDEKEQILRGVDWKNSLTRRPNLEIGKH